MRPRRATSQRIALGIAVMCLYVIVFNRLFWRRLYDIAAERAAARLEGQRLD